MRKFYFFFFLCTFLFSPAISHAQSTPATMQEFWDNNAQFVFHAQFNTPTVEEGPNAWKFMNLNNSIVARGATWYLFNREYYQGQPSYCPPNSALSRITVRKSEDKGKTWTNKRRIVEPVPGTANECGNTDGDAYYDESTNTWHYIYQCFKHHPEVSGWKWPWTMCHASMVGPDPTDVSKPFIQNPQNPVVPTAFLWNQIQPPVREEGTPEIVKKEGEFFYVTFHGISDDDGNLYRGIARTRDFVQWDTYMKHPIFTASDCQPWNIAWNTEGIKHGGCHGGGHGTILQEGEYYYNFMEASDMHYGILNDPKQSFVFGIVRTKNLTSSSWNRQWEQLPLGSILIDINDELWQGERWPYGNGYQKLFRDIDGTIYIAVMRGGVVPNPDASPMTGHYIYRLERNAPFLDYELREGENHQWLWSSIVSRTPSYAQVWNTNWIKQTSPVRTYHLELNNPNAYVVFPNGPQYLDKNALDMQLDANIRAKPATGSAFIYGMQPTLYLELYADGNLCGWIYGKNGTGGINVCTPITSYLNEFHQYQLSYLYNAVTLKIDGVTKASKSISLTLENPSQPIRIGSNESLVSNNFLHTFNGIVARARMSHHPLPIYSYIPGDFNRNRDFESNEMKVFLQKYNTDFISGDLDFNQKINALDFRIIRSNY